MREGWDNELREKVMGLLAERGAGLEAIAEIVYEIQSPHLPGVTRSACLESVMAVLEKRETQHSILTGVALDMLAEEGRLPEPLRSIILRDDGLYGVDEILALGITNLYGSVGLTNFGYLDKKKLGVIGRLNEKAPGRCHTFLDDLIAAVAAAAAARLAHQHSG